MSFHYSEDVSSAESGIFSQSQTQEHLGDSLQLSDYDVESSHTNPRYSQELPDYGYSQHGSYSQAGWAQPAPRRRTLPRLPTWPSLPRPAGPSLPRPIRPSLPRESRGVGDHRMRGNRWKFSGQHRDSEGTSGETQGREQDMKYHLSNINTHMSKLPSNVSKLLEEAVRFLVANQDKSKEELEEKVVSVTCAVEEIKKARSNDVFGGMEQLDNLENKMNAVRAKVQEQESSNREVTELLRDICTDLAEVKHDMKVQSEMVETLSTEIRVKHQSGHLTVKVEDHKVPQTMDRVIPILREDSVEEIMYQHKPFVVLELDSDSDSD